MSSPSTPTRSADWYDANPHARWSFSRLATFERCRGWFRFQYLEWHRTWTTPILTAGHAVQRALERVFDSEPAADVSPTDLLERAGKRLVQVFDQEWSESQRRYEADPNGYGDWDLPAERYREYARQGLAWHIDEVIARFERRHPRTGATLQLEPVSLIEAWREVRPWHAPEGDDFEETMERVPDGFFQGQYDLVYDWTGGRRIVDLKASKGTSAFSGEIDLQLAAYAWMEHELGRGEPEGLEAWFLGAEKPQVFDLPTPEARDALRERILSALHVSGSERGFDGWDAADFQPDPAAVPGHEPAPGMASAWCAFCPAAAQCELSGQPGVDAGDGQDLSEPSQDRAPVVQGVVAGIGEPRARSNGKTTRRFTLVNRTGAISFTWPDAVVSRLIDQGLRAGKPLRLEGLRPWRHPASGNILWYDSPATRLLPLDGAAEA